MTRYHFLVVLFALVFTACTPKTPSARPAATPTTLIATDTPLVLPPTRTLSPTPSLTPTETPLPPIGTPLVCACTPGPTNTPAPTHTASPTSSLTATSEFAPPNGPEAYTFKPWTADEMRAVIFDDEMMRGAHESPDFMSLVNAETRLRFPALLKETETRWRLFDWGMSNYWWPDNENDLALLLTEALNAGQIGYDPEGGEMYDIQGSLLKDRLFYIRVMETVDNLFGPNQPGLLVGVTDDYESFFAMQIIQPEEYRVIPILPWESRAHSDLFIDLKSMDTDLNQNGIPELMIWNNKSYGSEGCSYGYEELSIWEWQPASQQFALLDIIAISYNDCSTSVPDEWVIEDTGELAPLIKVKKYSYWQGVLSEAIYQWDGTEYKLTEEPLLPFAADEIATQGLNWALAAGPDSDEGVKLFAQVIQNWPVTAEDPAKNAARKDYYTLKLGIWYAWRGDRRAEDVLHPLSEMPSSPTYPLASQASGVFLDAYRDTSSLYAACYALDAFILATQEGINWDEQAKVFEKWGYVPEDIPNYYMPFAPYPAFDLCTPLDALHHSLALPNAPALAANAGQPLTDLLTHIFATTALTWQPADLNGDALTDFIVRIFPQPNQPTGSIFALTTTESGFLPRELGSYTESDPLYWQSFALTDETQLHFLQTGERLRVFMVENAAITWDKVEDWKHICCFALNPIPGAPELTLYDTRTAQPFLLAWDSHAASNWDSPGFDRVDPPNAENIARKTITQAEEHLDAAQQALFAGETIAALAALQSIYADLSANPTLEQYFPNDYNLVQPRLFYLLALAYELTGDTSAAAQTYWQLWHDHPETPYAHLASRKLTPLP